MSADAALNPETDRTLRALLDHEMNLSNLKKTILLTISVSVTDDKVLLPSKNTR